jgi:MFS family permease
LVERYDWRATYVVLAAILAAVTIPAHFLGLRGQWPDPPRHPGTSAVDHRDASRSRAFTALVIALSLAAFAAFAAVFNLVPLLIEQCFSPGLAALTLGLGGAGQVLGRIGYLPIAAHTGPRGRAVAIIAATAMTTALLGLVGGVIALIGVAIGAGLVRGVFTLVQATAITDRWGAMHYGRLNGLMTAPIVIVMALAPWAGTALSSWTGSYARTYLVLGAIALLAAVFAAASMPRRTAEAAT